MTHRRVSKFLVAAAIIMVAIGAMFLVRPQMLSAGMGVGLDSAMARTDVRAVYGGLELAIGVFLAWCAVERERHVAGLVLCVLLGAGLVAGRCVGFVFEGAADARNLGFGVIELAATLAASWVLVRASRETAS